MERQYRRPSTRETEIAATPATSLVGESNVRRDPLPKHTPALSTELRAAGIPRPVKDSVCRLFGYSARELSYFGACNDRIAALLSVLVLARHESLKIIARTEPSPPRLVPGRSDGAERGVQSCHIVANRGPILRIEP
jgi:hypothetical protein